MRETGALKASDLLVSAEQQLPSGRGRPLQTHLRRTVSTVYYALFHCLARSCADALVGNLQKERHAADYDPAQFFFKSNVEGHLRNAQAAVERFEASDIRHRRQFAAHVLFRERQ